MKELLRAASVIARRDFTAVVLSRTFILFLIGPLVPIIIGMVFAGFTQKISSTDLRPVVGIAMAPADVGALERAHARLTERMGPQALPRLHAVPLGTPPRTQLARPDSDVVAILSGTVSRPVLTGKPEDLDRLQGDLSLIASAAQAEKVLHMVKVERQEVATSLGAQSQARLLIGRTGQIVIFFLTILLAGMILSNLVEEKTNKIIEILAAAVPVDAITWDADRPGDAPPAAYEPMPGARSAATWLREGWFVIVAYLVGFFVLLQASEKPRAVTDALRFLHQPQEELHALDARHHRRVRRDRLRRVGAAGRVDRPAPTGAGRGGGRHL